MSGVDFIRCLLEYEPQARMTPAQALNHAWIVAQGPKQRTRMLEREQSLLREAARRRATPSDDSERSDRERPSKKRKASVLQLGKSLSTMSVQDGEGQATKRVRCEQGIIIRHAPQPSRPSTMSWPTFDSDEIPGLGLSHG